jgi:GxxExxY protein
VRYREAAECGPLSDVSWISDSSAALATSGSGREIYMQLNYISSNIIQAAINVHRELGPGLLESVYKECMVIELAEMGLNVETEIEVPVMYRGQSINSLGYRLDLLVEDRVIVELKSVEQIRDVHKKQLLTYLRLSNKELGLLINFNVPLLKNGITRIVNSRLNREKEKPESILAL